MTTHHARPGRARSAPWRVARVLAAVALVAMTSGVGSQPAGAQVTGGCSATIAGRDANAAHNASHAIGVASDETIVVSGTAPGPITGYQIFMKFGPVRFKVADGTVSTGETSYTRTINVADYAKYGVGLYRVEGETAGTPCTGWAYVKVTGRFPLFTAAGALGAVLVAVGALGMVLSLFGRAGAAAGGTTA